MIRIFWLERVWLIFFFPFIITFHNYHASILNTFQKGPFACKFFNSPIDDHVEVCFLTPFHEGKFPIRFQFLFILFDLILLILVTFFNHLLFFVIFWIQIAMLDDRDVSSWADVIRNWVQIRVHDIFSSSNLKKSPERESLEHSSTHFWIIFINFK